MFCAIDFGTSNSGIALPPVNQPAGAVRLLEIEPGHPTMPTAVFYAVEGLASFEPPRRLYGRAAVAAYIEGTEGRLMRSMKSLLGSSLLDQRTDLGAGHSVSYRDVVAGYLRQLKQRAEAHLGALIERAVLGRPVFFVDDDLQRILAAAHETLRLAGVAHAAVDALYLTGGSTGLAPLAQRLAAVCPGAQLVRGDRFASVAQGLGLHAQRLFAKRQARAH